MSDGHGQGPDGGASGDGAAATPDHDDPDPDPAVPGEERLSAPHTERSPEEVLQVVLEALRTNDEPHEAAGLRTAFNFASPQFRSRVGGSLEAFVEEFTDPINEPLVDHREAKRGRLQVEDGEASEQVIVTGEGDETNTYEFFLRQVTHGKYEGCWMVDAVDLVYAGAAPDHQHMPMVEFDGVELKCKEGDTLRDVLLRASDTSPHNGTAQILNCGGDGLCGTCAVEIVAGEVTDPTSQERRRMKLPPLNGADAGLRLSCQSRVLSDLVVRKHGGICGQHVEQHTEDDGETGEPIRISDEEYLGEADLDDDGSVDDRTGDDLDVSDEAASLLEDAGETLDDDPDDPDGSDDDDDVLTL